MAAELIPSTAPADIGEIIGLLKTVFVPQVKTWINVGVFHDFVQHLFRLAVIFGSTYLYVRYGRGQADIFDALGWLLTAAIVKWIALPYYADYALSIVRQGDFLARAAMEHFLGDPDMSAPFKRLLVLMEQSEPNLSWDAIWTTFSRTIGSVLALIALLFLMAFYLFAMFGTQVLALIFVSIGYVTVPAILVPAFAPLTMHTVRGLLWFMVTIPAINIAMAFASQLILLLAAPSYMAGASAVAGLAGGGTMAQAAEYIVLIVTAAMIVRRTASFGDMVIGSVGAGGTVNPADTFAVLFRGRI